MPPTSPPPSDKAPGFIENTGAAQRNTAQGGPIFSLPEGFWCL